MAGHMFMWLLTVHMHLVTGVYFVLVCMLTCVTLNHVTPVVIHTYEAVYRLIATPNVVYYY